MLNSLGDLTPPTTADFDEREKLEPGLASEKLDTLREFAKSLHYIINRRYTRPRSNKVDAGGSTSAANVVAPNPKWHLIHSCADLFCKLDGRKLAAEDGTPFQQFVSTVHEWVTGEIGASFVSTLREYQKTKEARDELAEELRAVQRRGRYPDDRFAAALSGSKHTGVPQRVVEKALLLKGEIAALEDKLSYGNRIPARQIVTG